MPIHPNFKVYTSQEVMKLFNITYPTLWKLKKRGIVKPRRKNHNRRFRHLYLNSDIEAILEYFYPYVEKYNKNKYVDHKILTPISKLKPEYEI